MLAELLLSAGSAGTDAPLQAFSDRRYDRAKAVVDASLQLARWLLDHERGDVPGLMARISHLVSEPA